jgi:rhodanese-related sulfurtransferase
MGKIDIRDFLAFMENPDSRPDWRLLDVRHPREAEPFIEQFGSDRWLALPYDEVRERYRELPNDKTLVIVCNAGSRSYETQLYLRQVGIERTLVLAGGMNVVRRLSVDWLP